MTRLLKLLMGVLPLAIFFAAFAAVGDVLVATTVAVAGAIAQLVLTMSANKRTGVLVWISLAHVLGRGSATLAGTDVRPFDLSPQPASCEGANCVCRMPVLPI
jgi:intracellular septation protein A